MRLTTRRAFVLTALLLPGTSGCETGSPAAPTSRAEPAFALHLAPPLPSPLDFVNPATNPNPYFPLIPGTIRTYNAETEDGLEETIVTITDQTRVIAGITATVVLDEVFLEGQLIERTFDWFGQDRWGNVWYLGEESCEFEAPAADCEPAGSWETGQDVAGVGSLAEAGILMWANPAAHQGQAYRQEYYEGEAEDMARVLHTGLSLVVGETTYDDCIETMDWTPLEPGAREHKFYCAAIGLVQEVQARGGRTTNQLVALIGP